MPQGKSERQKKIEKLRNELAELEATEGKERADEVEDEAEGIAEEVAEELQESADKDGDGEVSGEEVVTTVEEAVGEDANPQLVQAVTDSVVAKLAAEGYISRQGAKPEASVSEGEEESSKPEGETEAPVESSPSKRERDPIAPAVDHPWFRPVSLRRK